jgi:hypothetical protein
MGALECRGGSRYEVPAVKTIRRATLAGLALFAALFVPACGREIGDECRSSADCDPNGTRSCDLSQPGGYCTVVGCGPRSCPEDSACIRYFPEQFLASMPECRPACEDVLGCPAGEATCEACPQGRENVCLADELCLDSKRCAKRTFEQRQCAKVCEGNDDCRGGYECRMAGTGGSMLLSTNPAAQVRFCSPIP